MSIFGLELTGAALQGASAHTSLLLLAYAAEAATSLAVALLIGGRVSNAMKRSLGAGEWIRRGLGVAVLAGVIAIGLGLDTGLLTRVSLASTLGVEQALLDKARPAPGTSQAQQSLPTSAATIGSSSKDRSTMTAARLAAEVLPVEGQLPSLGGAVKWLNSPPLSTRDLRGKVVLVDFWTYSCINCLRAIP